MKLSETKFRQTVELLQSMTKTTAKMDKRRASRAQIRIPVEIKYTSGKIAGSWIKAELRDLSPRGLCVCVRQPLEEGQSFVVRFPAKKGAKPATPLICRVIHCKPQKDQTHLIGSEFTGHLDTAQRGADSVAEAARIRGAILG
jgi:hypothetical protein